MNSHGSASEIYCSAIMEQAPRVLSLMDREVFSPTSGCCDRTYWAWKFVDFPGARFQEALCVLSFLYSTQFDLNSFYHNTRLLEWIENGLRFWSSIQHPDGSFDEAYPFERSLAATAFTTFYVAEALECIRNDLPTAVLDGIKQTMAAAGRWLIRNDETHGFLSNHLAAAVAALYHVYRITSDESFKHRSLYFLQRIIDHQSNEGWYEEYGGADPGYQTHGTFYLTRYWQLSKNKDIEESIGRSMIFLAHFIHPDQSIGGEYASRNTQTYYPAAFEMFAVRHSAAAWIAETMRPSVLSGASAGLRTVDTYNYFPFLNNLVFAYRACTDEDRTTVKPEEPASHPGLVWFPEAGIARIRRERYDAYIGTKKGGIIKVFDRSSRKLVYSDCGYIGRLHGGRIFSSQYQDNDRKTKVQPERIEIEGAFCEISRLTMRPFRFVGFRLFTLTVGRLTSLGAWLKRLLVKVLIYRKKTLKIRLRRVIEFDEMSVSVFDNISGQDGSHVESLNWGDIFTTIHMGSSRYFINNELIERSSPNIEPTREINPQEIASGVTLQRAISFNP